jgi:PD-(D/E)XK nuclease superfamily protein/uncharacterized protein DUF2357
MPTLVVYPRDDSAQAVTVWPLSAQIPPAGLIQEKHSYTFELRGITNPNSAELFIDDEPLVALRSPDDATARWAWTPDFYAGQIRLRVKHPAGISELELTVDPDLSKLTHSQFDSMVRDILEDTTALFSLSGFRFGVAKGTGLQIPPLARLEFIRSRITVLEQVVSEINQKPVRVLSGEKIIKPLAAARSVGARDIYTSFYKHRLRPAPPDFKIGEITVPALPMSLTVGAKTASEDIAENRAIKTCLNVWRSLLTSTAGALTDDLASEADEARRTTRWRWSRRCRGLASRLSRLLELPLFEGVSDSSTPLRISSIFRRVPQYHRFLLLYRDMNLGFAQIQGDFLNLPLSRTFDLYELWVFLRLCRAAGERYGVNIPLSDFFVRNQSNLGVASLVSTPTLTIRQGVQIRFKRQYREYWRDAQNTGSFSRTMIPDMSVERAEPPSLIIVLDAKYRIGDQLNDALSSIHMYRDAIVRDANTNLQKAVVAAYLITPDLQTIVGNWRDAEMPARLFHPEYRQTFHFGALTLKPGGSVDDAKNILDLIMADAAAA